MHPYVTGDFLRSVLAEDCETVRRLMVAELMSGGHPYRSVRRAANVMRHSGYRFSWKEFA